MFAPPPLPRSIEAAFRDVGSTKSDVRAAAARDVARHALADAKLRERAVQALSAALEDAAPLVRSAAALGLGELEAKESLPRLLLCVEDENNDVRQMALTALGELGDERALPRLRRALTDERPEVRYQAVIAVARLASPSEIAEVLAASLADSDGAVRYIALRVGEERLVELVKDSPAALPAFAPLVEAAAGLCVEKGLAPRLVLPAAILLARAGRRDEAARFVRDAVRGALSPIEKEDEQEAVELAGELGLSDLVPDLERRAYGAARLLRDTCVFHATIALARLGHGRAIEQITRDLTARRGPTRAAAVVAAGRARLVSLRSVIASLDDASVDAALRREALGLLDEAAP